MSNTMSFATGEHANKMILPGSNHSHTPVQDFNGDGRYDIMLQHDNSTILIWDTNGTGIVPGNNVIAGPGTDFHVV